MSFNTRITALVALGSWMQEELAMNNALLQQIYFGNRWFTPENTRQAIQSIAENFLSEAKLNAWLLPFNIIEGTAPKKVGIIMAGNLPMVGFHDLLCVLITGNTAVIKLSSKDSLLLPPITKQLVSTAPAFSGHIIYAERFNNMDAVIATGSNNSARYFEQYFGKQPHIIRKNRNSVAWLTGNENEQQLKDLGKDVFTYFGLGCRNVSHLCVPQGYDFSPLLKLWDEIYEPLMNEDPYKNNYDYNRTLLLMNKIPHLVTNYVMLVKNQSIASRIATLHYSERKNEQEGLKFLEENKVQIQCVVGADENRFIPFGKSQQPELWDYADGVDTMKFLLKL